MNAKPDDSGYITIKPKSNWLDLPIRELWKYRDLISMFVKRDFVSQYKQTILGPIWYIIQPLLSTTIFTVIFGKIARIPTDGIPPFLFYLSGLVCWNYFSECLVTTSNTFIANSNIFGKVYFPRLAVPISVVLSSLIKFSIQLLLFIAFFAYFYLSGAGIHFNLIGVLILPILVLQMAFLGLGFGILISALTTRYRDLTHLVGFGVQLWMYATPVVYPISEVPHNFKFIFRLNPMAEVISNFRYGLLGIGEFDPVMTGISLAITIAVVFTGIILFTRVEKTFMDAI